MTDSGAWTEAGQQCSLTMMMSIVCQAAKSAACPPVPAAGFCLILIHLLPHCGLLIKLISRQTKSFCDISLGPLDPKRCFSITATTLQVYLISEEFVMHEKLFTSSVFVWLYISATFTLLQALTFAWGFILVHNLILFQWLTKTPIEVSQTFSDNVTF